ncbi:MAG: alanine--tRNA ligase-related protein [Cyanobium sp. MAG06]|nr:alanine--tRNA ligase-related protein [Cyanobium sp. MAG06]
MPVGEPGGPDSEMFYDLDPNNEKGIHQDSDFNKIACHPNCDCGRFMEIGNNVFMQFQKTENGVEELKQQNVDFGGGLERLSAAANDDGDMFNLDVFDGAKNKLEELTGEKYVSDIAITWTDTDSKTFAYRVILDHIRAATFLIADGVLPGNKDREYFVKRLIRRAVRYAHNLNINNNWTKDIANTYIEYYKDVEYGIGSNLLKNRELILNELDKEESKFRKTLENGIKEFEKIIEKVKNNNSGMLDPKEYLNGKTFFDLYQTFGFPFELSIEEFKRHKSELKDFIQHFGIDFEKGLEREFLQEKELHSQSSKTASAGMFKGGLADSSEITTAYHSVTHIMFAGMRKVLGETHQAGSNINAERLRFDFTFDRKLEDDEVKKIEDYVNNAIQSGFVVETIEMDKNLAKESGVEGSF